MFVWSFPNLSTAPNNHKKIISLTLTLGTSSNPSCFAIFGVQHLSLATMCGLSLNMKCVCHSPCHPHTASALTKSTTNISTFFHFSAKSFYILHPDVIVRNNDVITLSNVTLLMWWWWLYYVSSTWSQHACTQRYPVQESESWKISKSFHKLHPAGRVPK